VLVEELSYGAVAVAQRLEDLRPAALIVVGAAERGREPGTVERRALAGAALPVEEAQLAVGDAVTGYVSIDLLVDVARALGALPADAVAIEVEPASTAVSEELSTQAAAGLDEALELVRAEVRARRGPAA
jgi:Ni,Fe-hydrogenase maturation factor